MSGFAYAVVVERELGRAPLAVGPFRSEERARIKAAAIRRGLARVGLDEQDRPVIVVPIDAGDVAVRDVVEFAR